MKDFIWKYFRFSSIRYKFMRKWFKGTYYLVRTGLSMPSFWVRSDTKININSCQGRIIHFEVYTEDGFNPELTYNSFDRKHLWLHHHSDPDMLFRNNTGMMCHCHNLNFTKNSISEINKKLR